MNIHDENSAYRFRVQSEREWTLVSSEVVLEIPVFIWCPPLCELVWKWQIKEQEAWQNKTGAENRSFDL